MNLYSMKKLMDHSCVRKYSARLRLIQMRISTFKMMMKRLINRKKIITIMK
jgi:hypothetical protein